jgi:parvulin-like peptidyl-prolyl isomerase
MRLSRRTNTIILWITSLGLLLGMVITFTPSLGGGLSNLGQSGSQDGAAALLVNGEPISELDLARLRQQNHALSAIQTGQAATDIELMLLDSLIDQEVLRQAAASVRVSGGDVSREVNQFREQQGVDGRRNDDAYLRVIGNAGYDDQGFRDLLRGNLRLQRFQDGLIEGVEVTDAEAEAFYELNEARYRSEERVLARMIVVDDEALASELREQIEGGESFAEIASESSLERADRAGALGAPAGSTEPQPVGRAALPTAVANAAFAAGDGGLTEVVEVAGRYYLVEVDEVRSAEVRPFAEVVEQVREDALGVKQQQVVQEEIARLRDAAVVTVPEESFTVYDDAPVALVGDVEILSSDLVRATYSNPQIAQALNPQTAELVVELFKPNFLQQLIDLELAYQGAEELDVSFLGTREQVAQNALAYVTRDAEASDEEIAAAYEENLSRYTVPPSADATQVSFDSVDAAITFRTALLDGTLIDEAAEAAGGTIEELGVVGPGVLTEPLLDTVLFGTDGFEPLPESDREVSDVLVLTIEPETDPAETSHGQDASTDGDGPDDAPDAAPAVDDDGENSEDADADGAAGSDGDEASSDDSGTDAEDADGSEDADAATDGPDEALAVEIPLEERFVLLIAERTAERTLPLEDVRAQVESTVLAAERTDLRTAWLDELRERIEVEDLLNVFPEPPVDDEVAPADGDEGSNDGAEEGEDATPDDGDGDAPTADESADGDDGEAGPDDETSSDDGN